MANLEPVPGKLMWVNPTEAAIVEGMRADAMQYEHVVSIDSDDYVTVRHPIQERFAGSLFDCPVLETVLDWQNARYIAPGKYRYVEHPDHDDDLEALP